MVYYDDAFGLSRQYGSGFVTPLPGVPISVPVSVPTPIERTKAKAGI
ncbi:hypothetical protein SS1G_10589 [Sclerotinia sclerotiorum 1980 UF-70]|uniref:Uncharacterized protein n=1 Tax=Sclerotinia sclerotiorum (strain ATCC 18683 / 1980 / Ss-1) TaxID=665079 RepID=A7EZ23_SCLS1|nr:hypothetical protein SS1G_10589 [Sclerotinia sclerotiorum 1980 UF-70]EDN94715.1 hypothetical protein SS1G_10589 [Sclerotinia sclerotiorum 1980 UF-70]